MTRVSICLADTLVLIATWYTMGNIHALARRVQDDLSLTSLLLVDGMVDYLCCNLFSQTFHLFRYCPFLVRPADSSILAL